MLRKTPTTNLMYFGELRSGRLDPQMGHLTCFVGGLYVLSATTGALQLNASDKHEMEIAQGIGKSCRESYIRTGLLLTKEANIFELCLASGLGPEAFHFERVDIEAKALRDNEKYYILRPEAIEAWFYLWRSTHDQIYRDWAWDALIVSLIDIPMKNKSFLFRNRVLKNIAVLKVVILVFVMFIQCQCLMMMFNKVSLLLKH